MPSSFDQNTVKQYGGVAWAKAQMNLLQPQAIESQISGYQSVRDSLNQIISTLNTANASLQSAWSGDAAAAASQTFTDTSNHTQNVVTAVTNTINQLQNAQTAATDAQNAMKSVPNEVPVPSGGFFGSISNAVSDVLTGTDPRQQAEQHNTAARTQAAEVLNKLSSSYDSSANNMNSIAGGGGEGGGFNPSTPSSGAYNLGAGSYGGGSGAAGAYSRTFSNGGGVASSPVGVGSVKNGVFEDTHTALQSATTFPESTITTPIGPEPITTTTTSILPEPVISNLGGGLNAPPSETNQLGPLATEEPPLDEGLGDGGNVRGSSKLGLSNVFGEEGFGNESGSTPRRSSSFGNGAFEGEGEPGGAVNGGSGSVIGEDQASMRPGAGGRGGGAMSEEEQLGSSKYSRGRFFGGEEPGEGNDKWIQPSVGGNESLLVKDGGSGTATGRVRSAYDGATDAEGNPLNMLRGVGARAGGRDEDDERGERPGYLKEDPEWWQSAEKVAPPVVE